MKSKYSNLTPQEVKKIHAERNEYNRQLCKYCGHSLIFFPKTESKICEWCKNRVTNETKGRFMYMMHRALPQNYKVIRIEDK